MKHLVSPESTIKWSKVSIAGGVLLLLILLYELYLGETSKSQLVTLICSIVIIGSSLKKIRDARADIEKIPD